VPLTNDRLDHYEFPIENLRLEVDPAVAGRVKWYVTPLIMGGSPTDEKNMTWLSYGEHMQLVRWWNAKYQELKEKDA